MHGFTSACQGSRTEQDPTENVPFSEIAPKGAFGDVVDLIRLIPRRCYHFLVFLSAVRFNTKFLKPHSEL